MEDIKEKVIIVDKLTKNFETTKKEPGFIGGIRSIISPEKKITRALRNISFSIDRGELIGFIGPNGAGKTTTLKVLSGLLYPTSGFTQVLGFDPWERKPEFLKQISLVMGQKNQLWWDLPAIETLKLVKEIYQVSDKDYKKNISELGGMLGVNKLLDTQVRRLSLGQRMKIELVAALLHMPKVLFLDEPTIGLDVIAQQKLRDFIYSYNKKQNATIVLTSHNMTDVADLARRVVVIDKGRILFDGNLSELVSKFAKTKIIKIDLSKEVDYKILEKVGKLKKADFPRVILSVPRETAAVAAAEILQNMPVADLTIGEEPIEDVIRRVFKGGLKKK